MGWLASATILGKALETWMHRLHHDASTGFRFKWLLVAKVAKVAKLAKTAKILYLVLVPAILILPVKYMFEA